MKKVIAMDSAYCSMGRWISVIVGAKLGMKLYEGKDLFELVDTDWTAERLAAYDARIADMTVEAVREDPETRALTEIMREAVLKAVEIGPCIIHERAAGDILKDRGDVLKVLLYNTNMEHRIPRAVADKTYDLEEKTHDELVAFICHEDLKRSHYRDAVCDSPWGEKESYDICLDSDLLSREKCAEILIEACQDVSLDMEECAKIIRQSFTLTK